MAAIVYQKNKKSGITYVYESISYWDKEKQQSRAKRKCIGKLNSEGNIVPTRKIKRKNKTSKNNVKKPGPIPITKTARYFYGATYFFDKIGENLNLVKDLKKCFPDNYKKILSIAYYLILEDKNPLSRFPKWSKLHKHPFGGNIPSQRSSDLFSSITEEQRQEFFRLQGRRRVENEYWAYDTTSISSYSNCLKQVKYGKNKDHDPLPQINLAVLFGEKSNIPFYYRKLAGNISDVKTIKNLIADMNFFNYKKIKLVLDRGFYSKNSINELFKNHLKFLVGTKLSLRYVKTELDKVRDNLNNWENYNHNYQIYAKTSTISWNYKQKRPYKGDTIEEKRRLYLHLYYNSEKAVEDEIKQNNLLTLLYNELKSGKTDPKHEKLYLKYFKITSTPIIGRKIEAKEDAIREAKKNYGYFSLISNDIKDPIESLEIYRNKDLVEKSFANLKGRLNLRRINVSSELSLDGKLFVEFIALIYLSYIKSEMQKKNLFRKYTIQSLLDEFDIIECFEQKGTKRRCGEITKKQIDLYLSMGITPPSLQ